MDEGTCQSSSGPPSPSDPRLEDRRQTHRAGGCKGASAGPEEGPRKSLGSNRPLANPDGHRAAGVRRASSLFSMFLATTPPQACLGNKGDEEQGGREAWQQRRPCSGP